MAGENWAFSIVICGRDFRGVGAAMPKMTGTKPYHCTVLGKYKKSCKKLFVYLRGLTNHAQKKHPLSGANDLSSQELYEYLNNSPNAH